MLGSSKESIKRKKNAISIGLVAQCHQLKEKRILKLIFAYQGIQQQQMVDKTFDSKKFFRIAFGF
jgi:hypothetical protein